MFVLPVGLGTRWRRLPLVTLSIGALWLFVFLFDRSGDQVFERVVKSVAETGLRDRARRLFFDYCRERHGSKASCRHYAVLVWTGFPGKYNRAVAESRQSGFDVPKRFALDQPKSELAAAERVRSELANCGDNRRCYVYKDIVWRFLEEARVDKGAAQETALQHLTSYGGYARAVAVYRDKLHAICAENACLVPGNINLRSLFVSEMRHGGLFHLLNNLFVLLIFGAYAELRSSRAFYGAVLLVGGTLGMAAHSAYFSAGDTIALGGSANVAAAMGLFFVFFFRRSMRFVVWLPRRLYTGTSFPAPVAYAFPLVFLLSDVIGGFDSGFAELKTANVAHVAHLVGFAVGALMGLVYLRLRPLPTPLLYDIERQDLRELVACRDLAQILTNAERMARVNPDNVMALEVAAEAVLRWVSVARPNENAALYQRGREFLSQHLATICALGPKTDRLLPAARILSRMPIFFSYQKYLARLGPESTLRLADFSLLRGHPILAFRLYDLYLSQHREATGATGVLATTMAGLSLLAGTRENDNALKTFELHHPDSAICDGIARWRRERRTA